MLERENPSQSVEDALSALKEEFRETGINDSLAIEGIVVDLVDKKLPTQSPEKEKEKPENEHHG